MPLQGQKGELYVRYAALIEVVAAVRCYRKDDRRHYLPLLVPQVLGLDVQQYPAACLITTGGVEYVAATPQLEAAVQEQLDLQFRTAADAQARAGEYHWRDYATWQPCICNVAGVCAVPQQKLPRSLCFAAMHDHGWCKPVLLCSGAQG